MEISGSCSLREIGLNFLKSNKRINDENENVNIRLLGKESDVIFIMEAIIDHKIQKISYSSSDSIPNNDVRNPVIPTTDCHQYMYQITLFFINISNRLDNTCDGQILYDHIVNKFEDDNPKIISDKPTSGFVSATMNMELNLLVFVVNCTHFRKTAETDNLNPDETNQSSLYKAFMIEFNNTFKTDDTVQESWSENNNSGFIFVSPSSIEIGSWTKYTHLQFLQLGGIDFGSYGQDGRNLSGSATFRRSPPKMNAPRKHTTGASVPLGSGDKVCELLVCTLGESLIMRRIPYCRGVDQFTTFFCSQHEDLEILERLHWLQIDVPRRRIFAIHSTVPNTSPVFTTLQLLDATASEFNERTLWKIVFSVELDFGFPGEDIIHQQTCFSPNNQLSLTNFNAIVHYHSTGILCLCVERPPWLLSYSSECYKIYLFHQGKVLTCSSIEKEDHRSPVFTQINNTLIVVTPNFTHLINVMPYCKPVFSLILPCNIFDKNYLNQLCSLTLASRSNSQITAIYNTVNDEIIYLRSTMKPLYQHFIATKSALNRLGLLNFLITASREGEQLREVFKIILSATCSPELLDLVMEFLVASTHARYTRNVDSDYFAYIENTTLKENVHERVFLEAKSIDSSVTVGVIQSSPNSIRTQVHNFNTQRWNDAFWQQFSNQVDWHHAYASLRGFTQAYLNDPYFMSGKVRSPNPPTSSNTLSNSSSHSRSASTFNSFMRNFSSLRTRRKTKTAEPIVVKSRIRVRPPSRTENLFGPLPFFLEDPVLNTTQQEQVETAVQTYLTKLDLGDSIGSNQRIEISGEYVSCLLIQIRLLFHIIHCLLGSHLTTPDDLKITKIAVPRAGDDRILYHALNNILLGMRSRGFPIPVAVDTLYLRLAYRQLHPTVFLARFRHGCFFVIDETFALEVVMSSDSEDLKVEVLSRLPPESRMILFKNCSAELKREILADHAASLQESISEGIKNFSSAKVSHVRKLSSDSISGHSNDFSCNPVAAWLNHIRQLEENKYGKQNKHSEKIHNQDMFYSAFSDLTN